MKLRLGWNGMALKLALAAGIWIQTPGAGRAAPEEAARAAERIEALGFRFESAAFVRAITARQGPLVDLFLLAGIDPNGPDEQGLPPLLAAIDSRQMDIANALLHAGAEPQRADSLGRTALMAAVTGGHDKLIGTLLDYGADPAGADAQGQSALHLALLQSNGPLFLRLLEKTGPGNPPCGPGHDLLSHALEKGDWRLAEPLFQRQTTALARWNPQSRVWLEEALANRDKARIRLLLSKHAAAPTPENRRQPLLAYALVQGDRPIFELLLECGADPNCPLESPVEKSFLALVPPGAVRNYLQSEPGMNLLMLAAGLARTEDIRLLLEKGARRGNATSSKHRLVPLYFAAWAKSPESLQALLGKVPSRDELHVEISLGAQRAVLRKNGLTVLSTSISTGRRGFATPTGEFVVTDKDRNHFSSIYKVKMPFFQRLSCKDFGLHEGNTSSAFASHGCIRLPGGAARQLFRELPIGTWVSITP